MSETYHLVCTGCNEGLWIGQGTYSGADLRVYSTKKHLADMQAFLTEHALHPLIFGGMDRLTGKGVIWVDLDEEEDEDGSDDDDLYFYGNATPPLAVPVSSGEAIPDLSEPWRKSPREQYYADLTEQLRKQVAALQPSLRIEQQYIGLTFWGFSHR